MKEFKEYITENLSETRNIAARKILGYFGVTTNGFTYSTSYGFSFDNFRGITQTMQDVMDLLDKNNIKYKLSGGSMHEEIKISSKKDSLERFVKLGDRCWKEVEKTEDKYLKELKSIVDKIDKSKLNAKYPNTNSIIRLDALIKERENTYKKYFYYYNFENELKTYKIFLNVSGDIDKVRELYFKNKALGLREYNVRLSVLLDAEYERLTGQKL